MQFSFKRRTLGHNFPTSTQIIPLNPQTHSSMQKCLAIPEILERIFSFISDKTMTNTVIRVCREWHTLGRHRRYREHRWDKSWSRNRVKEESLLRVSEGGRLIWRQDFMPNAAPSTLSLCEIELCGTYSIMPMYYSHFPLLSTIRSFKLKGTERGVFNVDDLLVIFPRLEILHIEKQEILDPQAYWFESFGYFTPSTMLRSLVLRFGTFHQECVQLLMNVSPHLQDVQLIDMQELYHVEWDPTELFSSVPNSVQSFHFSMRHKTFTDEILEQMVMVCPESQHRILWSYQLTPTVIRILSEQHTFLTTLDILWCPFPKCTNDGWYYFERDNKVAVTARTLHELLCTAPSLLHLKVLKAPYIVQNMDIYRRSTMGPENHSSNLTYKRHWSLFQPGIWKCKNLNTLHLQVHGHGPFPTNVYTLSRILYGYISVICPYLTELRLESAGTCSLDPHNTSQIYILFDLFAGLCLLSRLKLLERLFLVMDEKKKHELLNLNWLCTSGRTVEYKTQRKAIVEGWQGALDKERQLERARLSFMGCDKDQQQTQDSYLPEIIGSGDDDLMLQLKDLGLLVDVRNQIQQMDSDGYRILPYLELLSLGKTVERPPEDEIKSRCKLSVFGKLRHMVGL